MAQEITATELHDHVKENGYADLWDEHDNGDISTEDLVAVENVLDGWLLGREPGWVTPTAVPTIRRPQLNGRGVVNTGIPCPMCEAVGHATHGGYTPTLRRISPDERRAEEPDLPFCHGHGYQGIRYDDLTPGLSVIVTTRGNLLAVVTGKFKSVEASDTDPAGTEFVELETPGGGSVFFAYPHQLQPAELA